MGQGVRTGLGHGGFTCVLQTQFSSLPMNNQKLINKDDKAMFNIHRVLFADVNAFMSKGSIEN